MNKIKQRNWRIFGGVKNKNRKWRKIETEEVIDTWNSPIFTRVIKAQRAKRLNMSKENTTPSMLRKHCRWTRKAIEKWL